MVFPVHLARQNPTLFVYDGGSGKHGPIRFLQAETEFVCFTAALDGHATPRAFRRVLGGDVDFWNQHWAPAFDPGLSDIAGGCRGHHSFPEVGWQYAPPSNCPTADIHWGVVAGPSRLSRVFQHSRGRTLSGLPASG